MATEEIQGGVPEDVKEPADVEAGADVVAEEMTTEGFVSKRYPIAPGYRVNVRTGPGSNYQVARVLPVGTRVPINCQKPGTTENGPYGRSNIWDNIGNGEYVSDAFVHTGSDGYVTVRCA